MQPAEFMTAAECRQVRGVLFDVDDTFTYNGKIRPEAMRALWDLHAAGLILVPITGGPAGWCDHMVRAWPIDGVIAESGAVAFHLDPVSGALVERCFLPAELQGRLQAQMPAVLEAIRARVPAVRPARDQRFRLFDLAIDYAQDVRGITPEEIESICAVLAQFGLQCRRSSIHINAWFGDYDKLSSARTFVHERFGLEWQPARRELLYIGDAPNDEPMFAAFDLSVGVANIARFAGEMRVLPRYVTLAAGGLGFAEMAEILLAKRSESDKPANGR